MKKKKQSKAKREKERSDAVVLRGKKKDDDGEREREERAPSGRRSKTFQKKKLISAAFFGCSLSHYKSPLPRPSALDLSHRLSYRTAAARLGIRKRLSTSRRAFETEFCRTHRSSKSKHRRPFLPFKLVAVSFELDSQLANPWAIEVRQWLRGGMAKTGQRERVSREKRGSKREGNGFSLSPFLLLRRCRRPSFSIISLARSLTAQAPSSPKQRSRKQPQGLLR